ncbi:MAG: family 16 glycoside hydrolase [Actinomycetota bacterium]
MQFRRHRLSIVIAAAAAIPVTGVFVIASLARTSPARARITASSSSPSQTAAPSPIATPTPTPTPKTSPKPSSRHATAAASTRPSSSPKPATTILKTSSLPAGVLLQDGFGSYPSGVTWAQGSTHGSWFVRYNGYGRVWTETDGSAVLALAPKASTSTSETHAALVTTTKSFGNQVDISVRARTVKQLRTPTPNAWEVPWLLWDYTDDTHFYYLVLKPEGWELGKEDPAYPGAQRFLATDNNITFPVGPWYTLHVRQVGSTITAWANGTKLVTFTDGERPYSKGSVGLYTEDARVHFDVVRIGLA